MADFLPVGFIPFEPKIKNTKLQLAWALPMLTFKVRSYIFNYRARTYSG